MVNGLAVCYYMALTFLAFQTVDDARWLITSVIFSCIFMYMVTKTTVLTYV